MRVLLSTVGTRGDVQPVLAVAVALRGLGHEARLCVPPNFVSWATELGFEAHPLGIEMRPPPRAAASGTISAPVLPDLITDYFDRVGAAADGCGVILGANAHQYAARSIAELRRIPFIDVLYAPVALPSPNHAPPPAPGKTWEPGEPEGNAQLWIENRRAWNARALEGVNSNRTRLGLAPINDVLHHVIGDRPWLAADATLGPLPAAPGLDVFRTGAWILDDTTALPPKLEAFLDRGEPPIYFGFGSMPTREGTSNHLIGAARALGRRAIVSRGWGGLDVIDDAPDCFAVGDVNQQALFPRVAAVVHHGGAGTTTTAARAGVPQVITPMFNDQFYWGHRVRALGLGTFLHQAELTAAALSAALHDALEAETADRARATAPRITADGAAVAARALMAAGV